MTDSYNLTFFWPYSQANDVIVTGTFDQWKCSIHLMKTPTGFEGHVPAPWSSKVLYKFVIDGRWLTLDGEPTEVDNIGNVNNVAYTPKKPVPALVVGTVENVTKTVQEVPPTIPVVPHDVQFDNPVEQDSTPIEEKGEAEISHAHVDDEDGAFHTAHSDFEAPLESATVEMGGDSPPPTKVEFQDGELSPTHTTSVYTQESADQHTKSPSSDSKLPSTEWPIEHEPISPEAPTQAATEPPQEAEAPNMTTEQPPGNRDTTEKKQGGNEKTSDTDCVGAKQEMQNRASEDEETKHKDVTPKDVTTKQNVESVPSPSRTVSSHAQVSTGRSSDVTVVEKENPAPFSKGIARKNSRIKFFLEKLESMLHLKKGKRGPSGHAK